MRAIVLGAFALAPFGTACAAQVRVLCPSALRAPVLEAARAFARSSGQRVEFIFASVGAIHKRVATGERADVAIGTTQGVDALVRLGRGIEGTQAPLVHSALALVLPRNATPDVSTAEQLGRVLRDAASIAQPDPSLGVPGGGQAAELLERLGIKDEVKERTRFVADPREVVKRVAAGAVEVGIAAMSDVMTAADVAVLGPLEEPATSGVSYGAIVIRGAANAEQARDFIRHLRSSDAAALFRKAGYTPLD